MQVLIIVFTIIVNTCSFSCFSSSLLIFGHKLDYDKRVIFCINFLLITVKIGSMFKKCCFLVLRRIKYILSLFCDVFEESAISFKIHCTHLTKSELLFLIFHSQILLYVLALCKCWLPIVKFEEITFLTNSMLNHSMFKSAEAHQEPRYMR